MIMIIVRRIMTMIFRRMKHKKYLRKQVEGEDGEARDSEEVMNINIIIVVIIVIAVVIAIAIILILRHFFTSH